MAIMLRVLLLACCLQVALFTDPECVIELRCRECVPDNMPLVTSHRAVDGAVTAAAGDELALACPAGRFLVYPQLQALTAVCEGGRYRVSHDRALRHVLELGCQESRLEDVLHAAAACPGPLQGRGYLARELSRGPLHLAQLCYDADRALPLHAHACNAPRNALRSPPHSDDASPLSLLGNFNHMFDARTRHDAERLFSDDERLNRRLRELLRHERVSLAGQTLTAARLLAEEYFDDQNARVADFASNQVAAWASVVAGNLRHLHRDVGKLMRLARPHAAVDVYAGTHSVASVRSGHARTPLYLKAERRFPVPRYLWTAVRERRDGTERAMAVVVLNEPLVAVSEVREAVLCESLCGRVSWLHELRRNRNYETPLLGLVFCCGVHNLTHLIPEIPRDAFDNVAAGNEGLLTDFLA